MSTENLWVAMGLWSVAVFSRGSSQWLASQKAKQTAPFRGILVLQHLGRRRSFFIHCISGIWYLFWKGNSFGIIITRRIYGFLRTDKGNNASA